MRIFVTVLGHNTAEMIRGALENFDAMSTDKEHRSLIKTVYDTGFPLGDALEREKLIRQACVDFGYWYTKIPNEGVMANHNLVIHDYCKMQKGDYYFCGDPDVRLQQSGFFSAAVEALESDPDVVFVCPALPFHNDDWCWKQHGREIVTLPSGLKVSKYKALLAWSTGLWKGDWLAQRPRDFKAVTPRYGWTEHADIALMAQHGKKWLSLTDYYDHHLGADAVYCEWKHAAAKGETMLTFADWLKAKRAL